MKTRLCPCGCGKTLGRYNGHRAIVCYETWGLVPREHSRAIYLPGSDQARRASIRAVLEFANRVACARHMHVSPYAFSERVQT